jgi:glycosyltransferase involved in cell wall biosynthesis
MDKKSGIQHIGQRPTTNLKLSVVFSFFNEEDNIPELISRIRAVMSKAIKEKLLSKYEMVFVNDDSTDGSLEMLTKEAKEVGDVKVINTSRVFGVTPCVLAGFEYSSGDLVVYLDADLQDPPEVILDMLRAWHEDTEVDVIHTVRTSRAGETKVKLGITKLGYYILKKATSISLIPNAGDFKLLTRRMVDTVVQLREKKPFMRGIIHWVGYKNKVIYYERSARFAGDTKFPVLGFKVIRNFFESALISFSDVPLHFVSMTGLVMSVMSFLLLIHVLIQKILGHNLPGWSAIMVAILFLGGVQLIALGLIGLYISAIYVESKGRPNYIIASTVGYEDEEDETPISVDAADKKSNPDP